MLQQSLWRVMQKKTCGLDLMQGKSNKNNKSNKYQLFHRSRELREKSNPVIIIPSYSQCQYRTLKTWFCSLWTDNDCSIRDIWHLTLEDFKCQCNSANYTIAHSKTRSYVLILLDREGGTEKQKQGSSRPTSYESLNGEIWVPTSWPQSMKRFFIFFLSMCVWGICKRSRHLKIFARLQRRLTASDFKNVREKKEREREKEKRMMEKRSTQPTYCTAAPLQGPSKETLPWYENP